MKKLMIAGLAGGIVLVAVLAWKGWMGDARKSPPSSLQSRAEAAEQRLRRHTTQAEAKLALDDLKRVLRQMDKDAARQWIVQQLFKSEDVNTQLNLTIGSDQNLRSWPSYRVFLLDMIFLVDPAAAAKLARDLAGYTEITMDEFAVMLRNLARTGKEPVDGDVLKKGIARMLGDKDWLANPSTAFLEAFDIIVHIQDTTLVPQLLQFTEDAGKPKLKQAAFLTLERLAQARGAEVLPLLDQHAATHPGSRAMVSNIFARADVRDAGQRRAVADYLLNPSRTPEEVQGFASTFPNTTLAVSDNLVTRQKVVSTQEQMEIDRAAFDAVIVWIADRQFARWHPALQEAYQRLASFVKP